MGLFDKLRGNKKDNDAPVSYYYNWLSRDLGVAIIRQKLFAEIIAGTKSWSADLERGVIAFDDQQFPVEFLGSEAYASNTWLWGWVNVNGYPEAIYQESEAFYKNCMMQQMKELEQPELPLTDLINGTALASMAVAANSGRMCYYKAPYDGGAAFLLIKEVPEQVFAAIPPMLAINTISEIISAFPIHHGYLVDGIMEVYATDIQKTQDTVTGKFHDGSSLKVTFDELGRIKNMNTYGR